ncbi:hypothetical protein Clacol_000871 [Clathrus columnatus]|uniref:NADP-dependent oxidoreductase domain-containing protein n=1 Tax=Clathrus columnatus TaxID=1419009 RepID=A0AAV4ZXA1_9AGAM|nr:hypothetical protein Clacol_000871 [Clathrus columnatus]
MNVGPPALPPSNHIDTAKMYGNEKSVGDAVRESGLKREDVFITSKISSGHGHSYQNALATVDESLRNFGFDYVDLYLIHDPRSGKESRLEAYRGLLEAKKQGKVRSVGVSNFSVKHLEELKESGLEQPEVNQIELHPFCQQKPIVDYCRKYGIVIQAYCPLIRGKFDEPILQNVAKKHSKDVAQVLVRWSLQKGYIPLPKSSQPARIKSNADAYNFVLSDEDMEAIDSLDIGDSGAVSWNPVNVS